SPRPGGATRRPRPPPGPGHRTANSAALLREEFPALRSRLPTLWTNPYVVATVGGATLEAVKRYAESQKNVCAPFPPHG
ncbi:MAG TPA: transposase, partial [Dehalococcoidia bacterium]|nr:transposase [Dehalococcoidia bacterium]